MENTQIAHLKVRSFWGRAAWRAFLVSVFVLSAVVASHFVLLGAEFVKVFGLQLYDRTIRALTRVEIVRELVQVEQLPPEQLIGKYAKDLRVPKIIGLILLDKESGGGSQVYRFEPKVFERIKGRKGVSESESRMLASSHGVLQVMGFNAQPRCGIHWSKLYGPEGVFCGLKIMRENLTQHKAVKDIGQRVWLAFRDYNGSGPDAERYADHAMTIAGRIMLQQWEKEL